jgi:hypothetical protein
VQYRDASVAQGNRVPQPTCPEFDILHFRSAWTKVCRLGGEQLREFGFDVCIFFSSSCGSWKFRGDEVVIEQRCPISSP